MRRVETNARSARNRQRRPACSLSGCTRYKLNPARTTIVPGVPPNDNIDPQGLAVAPTGDLLVRDNINDRVLDVPANGTGGFGAPFILTGVVIQPYGLALDPSGHMVIADTNAPGGAVQPERRHLGDAGDRRQRRGQRRRLRAAAGPGLSALQRHRRPFLHPHRLSQIGRRQAAERSRNVVDLVPASTAPDHVPLSRATFVSEGERRPASRRPVELIDARVAGQGANAESRRKCSAAIQCPREARHGCPEPRILVDC